MSRDGRRRAGLAPTPCLVQGCRHPVVRSNRCQVHAAQRDAWRKRTVPTKRARAADPTVAAVNRAVVAAHRARFGDWCPGYGRAGHVAGDLCADHVIPIAAGGHPRGARQVLCRECNGRKAAR